MNSTLKASPMGLTTLCSTMLEGVRLQKLERWGALERGQLLHGHVGLRSLHQEEEKILFQNCFWFLLMPDLGMPGE